MKRILFLLAICFFACEAEQHPLMVDDDKAVALLLDLNVANVALNKYPIKMRDSVSLIYKSQICKMHNVKEKELDTILWQLQNDYDRYNALYKTLMDSLTKMQDKLGEIRPGTEMQKYDEVMDSIKNAN